MSDSFDLVAAHMERLKADMIAELNRDLFSDGTTRPAPPLTWRQRFRLRMGRISSYFATLWRALKGDDPYDVDYDY